MLETGAKAPSVRLKTLQGEKWDLQETLQEAPVLLVFFKVSCPTCQFTLPFLDRLSGSTVARIMTISQDDGRGTREFQDHFDVHLPAVLDEPRSFPASNAFQISSVPSLFLVEQDGSISWSLSGFHKAELEKLSARMGMPLFREDEKIPLMRPG